MLAYNEVLPKKIIILDGEPYEVVSAWVFRKQQRKPVNQTKLRNLKTGSMTEYTFHQPDKIEEADVELKKAKFIYSRNGVYVFSNPTKPSERFEIPEALVGTSGKFLPGNSEIDVMWFDDEPIQVRLPIKVTLKVKEAPPAVKGNTVQGGSKQVVLETGATVNTPLFIQEGDSIIINTETASYVERA
jgi:elongation factor P